MSEVNKVYEEINMEYFEKMERLVKQTYWKGLIIGFFLGTIIANLFG